MKVFARHRVALVTCCSGKVQAFCNLSTEAEKRRSLVSVYPFVDDDWQKDNGRTHSLLPYHIAHKELLRLFIAFFFK